MGIRGLERERDYRLRIKRERHWGFGVYRESERGIGERLVVRNLVREKGRFGVSGV